MDNVYISPACGLQQHEHCSGCGCPCHPIPSSDPEPLPAKSRQPAREPDGLKLTQHRVGTIAERQHLMRSRQRKFEHKRRKEAIQKAYQHFVKSIDMEAAVRRKVDVAVDEDGVHQIDRTKDNVEEDKPPRKHSPNSGHDARRDALDERIEMLFPGDAAKKAKKFFLLSPQTGSIERTALLHAPVKPAQATLKWRQNRNPRVHFRVEMPLDLSVRLGRYVCDAFGGIYVSPRNALVLEAVDIFLRKEGY